MVILEAGVHYLILDEGECTIPLFLEALATFHQGAIMNFLPTRPVEELVEEYIDAFWNIYEPMPFLKLFRQKIRFLKLHF